MDPSDQTDEHHQKPHSIFSNNFCKLLSILTEPIRWIRNLSSDLNPSFILGVVLVYGLSQGFNGAYFRVVTDYYWKDVKKLQPSIVQVYLGFYYIPWIMKPVWGLLTDVFSIRGYHRRPYFLLAGVLGSVSALVVALDGDSIAVWAALGCLVGVSAAMAIADVTIDACIVRSSIEVRSLAPDLQSLCAACSSLGSLVGFSCSGVFVHLLGPQEALGVMAIPPVMIFLLGFVIHEERSTTTSHQSVKKTDVLKEAAKAAKGMYKTIKVPQVWKPALFMFLSFALSINTHEGQFFWYTDPKAGPAFSQESVGIIYAVGAMASLVGVLIYHKTLKDYPFRNILFLAQLLYGLTGMLDLMFVLRWNLKLRIPDYFFVLTEECVARIVSKIRWMPMMVLNTRLCPAGIEGSFFALLACIDSLAFLCSKWGGGMVLHLLHVTRTDFSNLWLVILIRNVLRLSTLGFIFLVPKSDYSEVLIPSNIALMNKNSTLGEDYHDNEEGMPLVPVNGKNEI